MTVRTWRSGTCPSSQALADSVTARSHPVSTYISAVFSARGTAWPHRSARWSTECDAHRPVRRGRSTRRRIRGRRTRRTRRAPGHEVRQEQQESARGVGQLAQSQAHAGLDRRRDQRDRDRAGRAGGSGRDQVDQAGEAITDRRMLTASIVVLVGIVAGFRLRRQTGLAPSVVALIGAGVLIPLSPLRVGELLRDVEWETVPVQGTRRPQPAVSDRPRPARRRGRVLDVVRGRNRVPPERRH